MFGGFDAMKAAMLTSRILRWALASLAALSLLAVQALPAGATGTGQVTSSPQDPGGSHQIQPGNWLSAGYDITMPGGHSDATIHVVSASVSVDVSCDGRTRWGSITVSLPNEVYSIAAGDNHWYATEKSDQYTSYQGAAHAPNVCSGGVITELHDGGLGVVGRATLQSNNTTNNIQIRFHLFDAATNANHVDIDCGSQSSNPSGGGMCNEPWGPNVQTTAATYTAPTSAPSSSGTTAGTNSGGTTSGTNSGGTTSGGSTPSLTGGSSGGTAPVNSAGSQPLPVVVAGGGSAGGSGAASSRRGSGVAGTTATAIPVQSAGGGSGNAPSASASPSGSSSGSTILPAPALGSSLLQPVPVLVPSAVASTGAAGLPWNWFLLLAVIDCGLLFLVIARHRRRAAAVPVAEAVAEAVTDEAE